MDPRELKETPRDRREREVLEAGLAESPVKGKPLRRRLRNFRPDAESAVRALGGPLHWMRRLRAIEDATAQHERQLTEAWHALSEEVGEPAVFARQWTETAERWDFAEVNGWIERHNACFPAEARLPMDPKARDFVRINGEPYEREPLDAAWILRRWPPDLSTARTA